MQETEIIERIKSLCESRSWTFYRLAKESGITYSTLCTMLHKTSSPSIPTLIKICKGFEITLAEFFDFENESAMLTQEEKKILNQWNNLSEENKKTIEKYILYLLSDQKEKKT